MWPSYSLACRRDVDQLLKHGGSLSAYRANRDYGAGPAKDSWAWRLERDIERRFKVKHAVAVNSGTAALHAALAAIQVRGGEVVTSPYTFSATASAILMAGGRPVFADVDPRTFCITKETVKHAVTKKTKAILPVNLFGYRPDYGSLRGFGIPILVDGCQSVGASRDGRFLEPLCVAEAVSFNGTKNVPAGEAGALLTDSSKVAEEARLTGNHRENFPNQSEVGYNYRPNEVTCCIVWHGLQELEERNKKRVELAKRVWLPEITPILFPPGRSFDGSHVFYVFPFLVVPPINRDHFISRMKKRGITVGAGYIRPHLGLYPAFKRFAKTPLPVVTHLSERGLCLLYCLTPDKELSYATRVAEAMRETLYEKGVRRVRLHH